MKQLLDFIAKHESRGDYNIVWGGIRKADHPPRPLTQMTIQEVLDWQDSIDARYMSEASGRYQIMEDTLRGLYRSAGVPLSALYNEETQDKLAVALLRRRGLDDYLAGRISAEKFANALAREWASLPVVSGAKKGRSYYDGDGLNKAGVDVGPFLSAVRSVRNAPARIDPDPRETVMQTKTVRGAATSLTGLAVQQAGEQLQAVAPSAPDSLQYILTAAGAAMIVGGIVWVIWSRNRDFHVRGRA